MDEAITRQVNEIMKRMTCRKGFKCAASGFENLCRAKDIGLKRHLQCLELMPSLCEYSLELDKKFFCACPLRIYLTKKLHIQSPEKKASTQVT